MGKHFLRYKEANVKTQTHYMNLFFPIQNQTSLKALNYSCWFT